MQQFGIEFNQLLTSSTSLENGNTSFLMLNEHSGEELSSSKVDLPKVIASNLLGESLSESIYCNATSDTLTEYTSAHELTQQTATTTESIYNKTINGHSNLGVVGLEYYTNHLFYLSISNSSEDEWNKSKDRFEEVERSLERLDASFKPNRFSTKSIASLYKSKLESAHSMTKRKSEIENDIPTKISRPMQPICARTRSYSTKDVSEKMVDILEEEEFTIEERMMKDAPIIQDNLILEEKENKGDECIEMKEVRIDNKKDMNNAQEKPVKQRIARIKRKPNKEWPMEDAFYSNKHKKKDEIPLSITMKPSSLLPKKPKRITKTKDKSQNEEIIPQKQMKTKRKLPTKVRIKHPMKGVNLETLIAKQSPYLLKIRRLGTELRHEDLVVTDTMLGEGQTGLVNLGEYKGMPVACKSKRFGTTYEPFYYQIQRELKYAADLSLCRYINKYFGWIYCPQYLVMKNCKVKTKKLYVLQRYVANGDARRYLDTRESTFQACEALQASICIFSALTDAHNLGIGIVDLKLENLLIDNSGAAWLTDFGSCVEFYDKDVIDLDDEEVAWTVNVSAPEMISSHQFTKASDVFMATMIVAELLTVDLSDLQFYKQVLGRRKHDGSVQFSSNLLHERYKSFFPLLEMGLANESKDRPTAKEMLDHFNGLKDKGV